MSTNGSPSAENTVAEEYETWKKNCPYMYRMVSETALLWPSLTFQWLPTFTEHEHVITQQLLLGTYTSGADKEYLQIGSVQFPDEKYDEDNGPDLNTSVTIEKRYLHAGEVNRARYMPQDSPIVATASVSGDVFLYDIGGPSIEDEIKPKATLKHHTANGYGISWNHLRHGVLSSSSDDSTVALWDVQGASGTISPVKVYKDHSDIVNDVDFSRHDGHLLGSVSDDKKLNLYDDRKDGVVSSIVVHEDAVNSLAFSPFSKYLIATVSSDQTVAIWDTRQMSRQLHSFIGHSDTISCVQWSPHVDGILGSAGQDRRVILWDIRKIGEEQTPEDAEDGPPELLFMHGGHTNTVNDFGFNSVHKWCLGSVSDDNIAQIWCPSDNIVGAPEQEIPNNELE